MYSIAVITAYSGFGLSVLIELTGDFGPISNVTESSWTEQGLRYLV